MQATLTIRTTGIPGTNGTAMLNGAFWADGAIATAGSAFVVAFGGTSAAIDTTIAQGLCMGWTLSVAGSCTPQTIIWQSLN